MKALLFDCDGVLADTEKDGHRVAFNRTFEAMGLDVAWSVPRYGELLKVAGGKERMRRHFDEAGWPVPDGEKDDLIAKLHATKTNLFKQLVSEDNLPLRPGVARLVGEALAEDVPVAVCSTSNESAVRAIVDKLGAEPSARIELFCGDIVSRKKPDPAVYLLAAERLHVDPAACVVVEDSNNGLRAALAAGMKCIVTKSSYTQDEDFTGASRVVDELGDGHDRVVTLADCRALIETR